MAKITQTVSLTDVRIFAPIGYYEEEQLLGNTFLVNIKVGFPFQTDDAEALGNTLNYEKLFQIITMVMAPKRKLLESAAEDMLKAVLALRHDVSFIEVGITKTTPPFGSDQAHASVELKYLP